MESTNDVPRWQAGRDQTGRSAPTNVDAASRAGAGLVIQDTSARVEGRFEVQGGMQIGCELTGEVAAGQLLITETGNVNATVRVVDATIQGSFTGDLVASGTVEIATGGYVDGTIQTDDLVIARGATFRGSVTQLTEQKASPAQAPRPARAAAPPRARPAAAPVVASPEVKRADVGRNDRSEDGEEEIRTIHLDAVSTAIPPHQNAPARGERGEQLSPSRRPIATDV